MGCDQYAEKTLVWSAECDDIAQSYPYFESSITVLLVDGKICLGNERNFLVRCFGTEDVAQADILETF